MKTRVAELSVIPNLSPAAKGTLRQLELPMSRMGTEIGACPENDLSCAAASGGASQGPSESWRSRWDDIG